MNQGAALCDNIAARAARLGHILGETDVRHGDGPEDLELNELMEITRGLSLAEDDGEDLEDIVEESSRSPRQRSNKPTPIKSRSKGGIINFNKTWMYANSRLPPSMYPFRAYFETWRIICMAARASSQVYRRPRSDQREHYIDANWRHGTKAMVLKSSPMDDKNLIVFAIRGSQKNFMDWAINFRPAPTAPEGFLDDEGNACHAGFLAVAKAMVPPVAARLRQLLEQDPSRCSSSLLITGHSAGGAVASLLFMHMLATRVESELTHLTGCFKRVHCVTFGAPPVTFLPLEKPERMRGDKSIFLAFANEGDPIVRADKEYIFSLARLLAAPSASGSSGTVNTLAKKVSKVALSGSRPHRGPAPTWRVPPATLSNAGRVVVLRDKPGTQRNPVVEAVMTTDEQLRDVVFGDSAMHMMALYRQRVEKLGFAVMMGDEAG
jgi:SH3-like domain-containing protein